MLKTYGIIFQGALDGHGKDYGHHVAEDVKELLCEFINLNIARSFILASTSKVNSTPHSKKQSGIFVSHYLVTCHSQKASK
jgi:hypothetical protein